MVSVCFAESFVIFISFVHYPESTSLFTLFINKIYDMSVHCHIFFPEIPLDTKILFSLFLQCNSHCCYLDIYISRKIRLCVIDFELAKLINFLVWKFKSIIPIFLLIFEEFVKSTAFYTFLVSLVATIPKNCYLALAKKPTNERRYLKKLECYTFYLLTRTYFRLVLSYHYCNFGEVFSLDVV